MKNYSISVRVHIHDKSTTYPEIKPIDFSITENLPKNISPEKYLRNRISEELKRQFSAQSIPIDNMDEGAEDDPLA